MRKYKQYSGTGGGAPVWLKYPVPLAGGGFVAQAKFFDGGFEYFLTVVSGGGFEYFLAAILARVF